MTVPSSPGRLPAIIATVFAIVMVLLLVAFGTTNAFGVECDKVEFDDGVRSYTAPWDGTYSFKAGNIDHGGWLITVTLLEGEIWTSPNKSISHVVRCSFSTSPSTTALPTTTTTVTVTSTSPVTTSPSTSTTTTAPTTTPTTRPSTTTSSWPTTTFPTTTNPYTETTTPCPCIDQIEALRYQLDDLGRQIDTLSNLIGTHLSLNRNDRGPEPEPFPWWIVTLAVIFGGTLGGAVAVNAVKKWRSE